MKKIIFRSLITGISFLLLVGYGNAQTSHSSVKSTSANKKNQIDIKQDTNKQQGWRQLFDGKDLTGWKHVGKGDMVVEDGLVHGQGGMGLLYWTKEKLANCTIRVVYRMQKENSNSGVFIRIPIEPHEEWMPVFYGYEVQIDNHPETSGEDDHHITGTLYSLTKPLAKPGKPGPEWNTMEITLDGPRTIVYVNGEKVTDYKEGDPTPERKFDFEPFPGRRPDSGFFGLQNHGDSDVVYFKEVSVKPLTNHIHDGKK
jgi:hypothetical protein